MAAPLLIARLKCSPCLGLMLSLAHLCAIGLLWPLMLPLALKLAATVILVISLIFYVRYYALLSLPGSVVGLELSNDMVCTVETRRGERIPFKLLGSSFVAPYLAVLDGKIENSSQARVPLIPWFSSRSIVILPDGIDAEEFRRLRVLLRWKWKDPK